MVVVVGARTLLLPDDHVEPRKISMPVVAGGTSGELRNCANRRQKWLYIVRTLLDPIDFTMRVITETNGSTMLQARTRTHDFNSSVDKLEKWQRSSINVSL